jgi:hypothetical protein
MPEKEILNTDPSREVAFCTRGARNQQSGVRWAVLRGVIKTLEGPLPTRYRYSVPPSMTLGIAGRINEATNEERRHASV